jgi:hypothetical protein
MKGTPSKHEKLISIVVLEFDASHGCHTPDDHSLNFHVWKFTEVFITQPAPWNKVTSKTI